MPEIVEIIEELEIIQIISSGAVTKEDLFNSRQTVSKICQERGITRVLVDTTSITSLPDTLHLFKHSMSLKEPEIPRNVKFAIIVSDKISDDASFIEIVAQNRHVNIRNCKSRDQALSWLLK